MYADSSGVLHVDLEELVLATGGDPADPVDRLAAERAVANVAREHGLPFTVKES